MNLEGEDAQEADSVQPIGFGALRASGDQDAGRLDNVVNHAAQRQKSMQPNAPPGLKWLPSDQDQRWIADFKCIWTAEGRFDVAAITTSFRG